MVQMRKTMAKEKIGFYRPHKRVTFDNLKVDLKTGELVEIPSLTKQEFVAECDINNIIKQYGATGQLRHISAKAAQGAYLDLPDDLDFQASLETVRQAQEAFATLPSSTRARFENDPAKFLHFLSDPANQDEAIKLGFARDTRPPPKAPETPPTPPNGGGGGTPPPDAQKGP